MATRYIFVPVQALKEQSGPLGAIDHTCWKPSPQPSKPGPWEEAVTGPNEQGEFAVEFRRVPSRRNVRLTRDERERLVAECIQVHHRPGAKPVSIRAIEKATTIPRATIEKLNVWKLYVAERPASDADREVRVRILAENVLACIGNASRSALDILMDREEEERKEREELARAVQEQAEDMARDSSRTRRRRGR